MAGQNFQALVDVFRLAGFRLEIDMVGAVFLDKVLAEGLSDDVFEFSNSAEPGGNRCPFRRYGPVFDQVVEFFGRIERATGFYMNSVTRANEGPTQWGDVLTQGLSARQADPGSRVMPDLLEYIVDGHFREGVEFGVAKEAAQIALCEAYEGGGLADAEALTLYGIEDLVDFERVAGVAPDRLEGGWGGWDRVRHGKSVRGLGQGFGEPLGKRRCPKGALTGGRREYSLQER
jgi:hypothetical protein